MRIFVRPVIRDELLGAFNGAGMLPPCLVELREFRQEQVLQTAQVAASVGPRRLSSERRLPGSTAMVGTFCGSPSAVRNAAMPTSSGT